MLRHVFVFVLTASTVILAGTAAMADSDDRRAGTDGHVTAWNPDRSIIDVDPCPRRGVTWDYSSCGSRFRSKINSQLCRERGKGKHKWLYQVGDSSRYVDQTARCD